MLINAKKKKQQLLEETITEPSVLIFYRCFFYYKYPVVMFRLRALLRPVVHKLPPPGLRRAPPAPPSRCLGTHGRNEPREPLNSPKRAKEFIYRLQPKERTCLLKELQSFESIAIAQGKEVKREIPEVFTVWSAGEV